MRGFWYRLHLVEPVVLSASGATAGGHETLDHVPGSALLGAVASRLYASLDAREAWTTFHSGAVRFGNAYPCDGDAVGLPAPLSLHHPKARTSGAVRSGGHDLLVDLSGATWPPEWGQAEQLRRTYLLGDGRSLKVATTETLRTAIADDTGTADPGRLFDYSALPAGTDYAGLVVADAEAEASLEAVHALLRGLETLRIGRSRSAEYGRVDVHVGRLDEGVPHPASKPSADGCTRVYCLSDVALADDSGEPDRSLDGRSFGLADGRIDWQRSHLRSRRYSPFNAALACHETERIVLEKGSVLVFGASPGGRGAAMRHVGLHRAAGLGHVWIDPPFLGRGTLGFWAPWVAPSRPAKPVAVAPRPDAGARIRALVALRSRGGDPDLEWAEIRARALPDLYRQARRLLGDAGLSRVGPGPSQWGALAARAEAATEDELEAAVSGLLRSQRTGREDEAWSTLTFVDDEILSFGDWVRRRLDETDASPPRIFHLARKGLAFAKERPEP